jgi:4-hydroxybenzoate polyprenyltransferase
MSTGSTGHPDAERDEKGGVRTALAGLTTRGRSFLAAGIAAAICAYVLGQSDLLRVGLLLAALPLVCALFLYRTRYRVAGSRRLSPARVPAGSEARVHLRMDNVSRLPTAC